MPGIQQPGSTRNQAYDGDSLRIEFSRNESHPIEVQGEAISRDRVLTHADLHPSIVGPVHRGGCLVDVLRS
ncbi:hypothetical protein ACFJIW_11800 [Tahibacter sp. UC22_41]|uniref:hypothetical protein n=1 Tax=Tahibacter sp. UC22_41 TaxID=3350178 RepID=UPI0036D7E841